MRQQLNCDLFTPAHEYSAHQCWVRMGDCRLLTKSIEDRTIHLILTDPPYFIDGMGDDWDRKILSKRVKNSGVVKSLPIGMKFDSNQGPRLQKFLRPIAKDWFRVLRPGGFVLCFSQNRLVHHTTMALELVGFEIRDILAWKYEGQAKAFSQNHFINKRSISQPEKDQLIRKLGGRKTPQLKPQCELIVLAQAPREGTFVDNWVKWETGLIDVDSPFVESDRFPGTIVPVDKPKVRHGHMTIKPVDLLRHLIRIFSIKGGVVFDPFVGSGSTGVAARLEQRNFIGMEIDAEMARYAEQRIENLSV